MVVEWHFLAIITKVFVTVTFSSLVTEPNSSSLVTEPNSRVLDKQHSV